MVAILFEGKSDKEFFLSLLKAKEFRLCYEYDLPDKWLYNSFYKQKKHPFDFHHKRFDELKDRLENLFKDNS
jgi:hypothetical protein